MKTALLIICLVLLNSCRNEQKNQVENETQSLSKTNEKRNIDNENEIIIGSWKDTSSSELHFTLFADGTARSDNMKTLLYQKWRINDDKLILIVESIGNGTSSTEEEIYEILKLNENVLILGKNGQSYEYIKSEDKNNRDEKFIIVDTDDINQKLNKRIENLSAKEVMKLYYPINVNGKEGNEKIEVSEKNAENGNTLIILIHDNLLDDSLKGEKHIMELKMTNNKWTVISIKKNWKCQSNRGHTQWGIEMCT